MPPIEHLFRSILFYQSYLYIDALSLETLLHLILHTTEGKTNPGVNVPHLIASKTGKSEVKHIAQLDILQSIGLILITDGERNPYTKVHIKQYDIAPLLERLTIMERGIH